MNGLKLYALVWITVVLYLALGYATVGAGWIYDVQGVMSPTLANPVSASFAGEIEFPGDTTDTSILRIELTNEWDIVREVQFTQVSNTNLPIGARSFLGQWDDSPAELRWLDFDGSAASDFSSMGLADGGGWDAWQLSFADYQLGSIFSITNPRETPSVPEPGGALMAAIGVLVVIGLWCERKQLAA